MKKKSSPEPKSPPTTIQQGAVDAAVTIVQNIVSPSTTTKKPVKHESAWE